MAHRAYEGQYPDPGEGGFGKYVSMVKGVRASCKDLLAGFKQVAASGSLTGEDTVEEIIREWSVTDQESYISTVCEKTGYDADQVLQPNKATLFQLLRAIFFVENGGWWVDDHTILAGVDEAFT